MSKKKRSNTLGYSNADARRAMRRDSTAVNSATGLGTDKARGQYSYFASATLTGCWAELTAAYDTDGMAARICDALPEWGTMNGFKIKTPDEEFDPRPLFSRLEDLNLLPTLKANGSGARLMGGAGLIVHGGGSLETPWTEGDRVDALTTADAECLARDTSTLGGANQIRRGQFVPEFYRLAQVDSGDEVTRVHHSRVMRQIGAPTTARQRARLDGWGMSSLERPYRSLIRLAEGLGYAAEMLHTASVFILKIDGWLKAIAQGGETAEAMRAAVEEVFDSVDILHGYAIDGNSEMREITRNLSGVEPIVRLMVDSVRRNGDGIPRTILENEQPTGSLSAGSEGEFASWFARVASYQTDQLTPIVAPIVSSVMAELAAEGETMPEEWEIEWCGLHAKDEAREAQLEKTRAETAQIYYGMQAIEAHEIRAKVIKAGEFEEVDQEFEEPEPDTAIPELAEDPEPEGGEVGEEPEI